jgi:hypothetical protein
MSYLQPSLSSAERSGLGSTETRSSLDFAVIVGFALVGLGAAMFALGLFHGFEHGSCSTTGYSRNYGPVPHCAKGVGFWMLMLLIGIFVAVGGAILSGTAGSLLTPIMFVAVGAPFVVLGLRSGHTQLLVGSSAGAGRVFSGIFGGAFVVSGVLWGASAARGALSGIDRNSRLAGMVASLVGVLAAFAIAVGIASAIGPTTTTVQPATQNFGIPSSVTTRRTTEAINKATAAADKATRLAACVSAAGADTAQILRCEAKYMP